MSDNIVTRLREGCDTVCKYATVNEFVPCDKCEAADEIENLAADRDRWRAIATWLVATAAPEELTDDEVVEILLKLWESVDYWDHVSKPEDNGLAGNEGSDGPGN